MEPPGLRGGAGGTAGLPAWRQLEHWRHQGGAVRPPPFNPPRPSSLLHLHSPVHRVLRPLRALRQFRGMQVILLSLVKGLPFLLNIFLIFMLIIVVFAIMGVDGLGGG